jgi:tetratricopeptide (TPR) repeat protein
MLFLGNIYYRRGEYDKALKYYEGAVSYNRKNLSALHNISLALVGLNREDDAMRYSRDLYSRKKGLPENILLFGNLLFAKGRYSEAAEIYREGAESSAEDTTVSPALFLYNLAGTMLKTDDPEASSVLFERIMEQENSPDLIKGLSAYRLGFLYRDTDVVKAEEAFMKALKLYPESGKLAFDLALLHLKNSRYESAVSLLKGVDEGVDENHRRMMLGYAMYNSERYREARELFTVLDPGYGKVNLDYIIGDLYVKTGMPAQALEYYTRAVKQPGYEGAFINLIRLLGEEGDHKTAKELCEQYAQREPDNPLPSLLLGDIFFTIGNSAEAVEWLKRAEHLSENGADGLMKIAGVWINHGYHNNALLLYHKILDSDPLNLEARVRIAEVYMQTGHKKRAKAQLERVRERTGDLSYYYGISLLLASSADTEYAETVYRELIEDFPYRYEAYYNLSLLLIESGEYEESARVVNSCFKNVTGLDPGITSKLHSTYGYVLAMLGSGEEARREFAEALQVDPSSEVPLLNLRTLGMDER